MEKPPRRAKVRRTLRSCLMTLIVLASFAAIGYAGFVLWWEPQLAQESTPVATPGRHSSTPTRLFGPPAAPPSTRNTTTPATSSSSPAQLLGPTEQGVLSTDSAPATAMLPGLNTESGPLPVPTSQPTLGRAEDLFPTLPPSMNSVEVPALPPEPTIGRAATTATAAAVEIERRYKAALAFQDASDYAMARTVLQELMMLEPDYKDAAIRLKQVNDTLAEAFYQQGIAYAEEQLWREAAAAFANTLEIIPNYKDTAYRRAKALGALRVSPTSEPTLTLPPDSPTPNPTATRVRRQRSPTPVRQRSSPSTPPSVRETDVTPTEILSPTPLSGGEAGVTPTETPSPPPQS